MRLRFGLLGLVALAALAVIAIPSAAAQDEPRDEPPTENKIKTLIILLDGFRWNFLKLLGEETSGFKEFIKNGVSAEYVKSVFPSLSFPAWTTIGTGVYPETHGILANFFYSRQRRALFKLNDTTSTRQAFWWQGPEPVWTTATRHGLRVATILWGRSDVPVFGIRPEAAQGYEYIEDGLPHLRDSLERSVDFLEKGMDLVMTYSEHVDDVGHRYGPDSLEMKYTIGDIGKLLAGMFQKLEANNLKEKVNVVLIGDHGMSTVDPGEPIRLREFLDPEDVEQALGQGAFVSIYAKPGRVEYVFRRLAAVQGLTVWRRGEVPQDLHYSRNAALPDIIVSAKKGFYMDPDDGPGYLIRGLHVKDETTPRPHGIHGYQPDVEDMRTVFFAVGPDFVRNHKTGPIELVDEYQVFCHLLRIPAHANNGSWERVRSLLAANPPIPSWQEQELDHNVEDLIPNPIVSTPTPHAPPPGAAAPQGPQPAAPPPPPASLASGPVSLALSVVAGVIGWYIFLCIVTNSH